jgi:RNA recognition motif-containing protein
VEAPIHVTQLSELEYFISSLSFKSHKSIYNLYEMTEQARLKGTVYVGGLAPVVDAASLHAAFIPFGEIVDISLPKPEAPSSTDIHRGFGYVEFEDPSDALEAIENMDQAELFGRVIKVSTAKPQKNANEGLGSKTALWEQVFILNTLSCLQYLGVCTDRSGYKRKDG